MQRILANLLCFLGSGFIFLWMFDMINLYVSSKRWKAFIFNNKRCKSVFGSINNVCGKKCGIFYLLNKVKKILENDLEIYLYIKFRLYSFVYSNLSLFSVFSHFCFCERRCDHRVQRSFIVNFVLEFIPKFLIGRFAFKILVLMKGILLLTLIIFLEKRHYFLLIFVMNVQFLWLYLLLFH